MAKALPHFMCLVECLIHSYHLRIHKVSLSCEVEELYSVVFRTFLCLHLNKIYCKFTDRMVLVVFYRGISSILSCPTKTRPFNRDFQNLIRLKGLDPSMHFELIRSSKIY